MDLLAIIGLITVLYYLIYIISPWFLDSDLQTAFQEKFGKPISTLKGKVVWIVGASAGIGEELAYVLAEAGCKLILTARREEELHRVKANCINANKNLQDSDVEVYVLDICNLSLHEKASSDIISKFGKLDILVNNAGASQRAIWENIDMDVDKTMFDLNVFSQIHLSRIVTKYFIEVGQGHIVVNCSVAGLCAAPFSATYCATKHALKGYYDTLLIEKLGTPIKVTMIYAGPIQTNFLQKCFTEHLGKKYGENTAVAQNKVSANRCAKLMAIAMANGNESVWIAKPLCLQIVYLTQYCPNFGKWLIKNLGTAFLHRLRDTKSTIKKQE